MTDTKMTVYEIARLAGVGKSTVSRVLNNHPSVSEKVRNKVEKVIKDNGYQPSFAARALSHGRKDLICVLSTYLSSGYFVEVLQGIEVAVKAAGSNIITTFARSAQEYRTLWKRFGSQNVVDGFILLAPPLELLEEAPAAMPDKTILCSLKAAADNVDWAKTGSVTVDNKAGIESIMKNLYSQSCRRIVHITGSSNIYDSVMREKAFSEFCQRHPDVDGEIIPGSSGVDSGRDGIISYLEEHGKLPDAFVCFNDTVAMGAIKELEQQGLDSGSVIVTGCDGEVIADIMNFTTLKMPCYEIGSIAAKMLMKSVTGANTELQHEILNLQLVENK